MNAQLRIRELRDVRNLAFLHRFHKIERRCTDYSIMSSVEWWMKVIQKTKHQLNTYTAALENVEVFSIKF